MTRKVVLALGQYVVAKAWGETCGVIQALIWVLIESIMKPAFSLCNNYRAEGRNSIQAFQFRRLVKTILIGAVTNGGLIKAFTTTKYNTLYHLLRNGWLVIGTKSLNTKKLELNRSPKFVTSSFCCIITV